MSAEWGETGALIESAMSGCHSAPVHLAAAGQAEVEMVPDNLVQHWENAYATYQAAVQLVASSAPGDRAAAAQMARASRSVADAWREIAATAELLWWSAAAVTTAAQAFDHQAQDWTARTKHGLESTPVRGSRKRREPYPAAAETTDHQVQQRNVHSEWLVTGESGRGDLHDS